MEKRTRMNPRPGGRMQRGVWAALLCAVLCVLLCGCQSVAEPETMEVQEPAIQAAPVPEPEPEPAPAEPELLPFEPEKPFERISEFSVMSIAEQGGKPYWKVPG